ncbi:MAG TPA: polysaccharide deacetylase family protein [Solirubrobacterales bacterium]|nr:polysaccharide deacetylase family protein [Solirubrobacterales bacterium]
MSRALANRSREAVFLCYHSIAARGEPYLALSPQLFERQLALLRRLGYRSGGLEDLERLGRGERLPRRTVFLTFDDGFRDNLLVGQPLMAGYGFHPIVFVLPPLLDEGRGFEWPELAEAHAREPQLLRSLTWAELDRMVEQGAEVGSHTLSHPHLCELDDERLAVELGESRRALVERFGSCEMLAYPFGEWDPRVALAAGDAGYRFAFSLPQRHQRQVGPLCIPRLNVDFRDRPARFAVKLSSTGRRFLLAKAADRLKDRRGGARPAGA